MTATLLAVLWACSALSTNQSIEYTTTSSDPVWAQKNADYRCSINEDPNSYDSCIEMGCHVVDGMGVDRHGDPVSP